MKAKRKAKPEYPEKLKNRSFAERVVKAAPKINTPKVSLRQQELMYVFNFSWRDLEANRRGEVPDAQRVRLLNRESKRWQQPLVVGLVLIVASAMCGLITIGFMNLESNLRYSETIQFWFFFAILIFIGVLMEIDGFSKMRRLKKSIQSDGIKSVQGIAIVDIGDNRRKPQLTINDYHFVLSRRAILRIKHLEPHIVYFLPRSKIIVSVEVVES